MKHYRNLSPMLTGAALIVSGLFAAQASAESPPESDQAQRVDAGDPVKVESERSTITFQDGIVTREYKHALPEETRSVATVVGRTELDDGKTPSCRFEGTTHVRRDEVGAEEVMLTREIAYDPSACTMTLERAVVGPDWLAEDELSRPQPAEGPEDSGDDIAPEAASLSTSASLSKYYETRYEDPPNIDVTRLRVRLNWTYNGSCVTASSNHVVSWYKATATGWQKHSGSVSSLRECARAKTTATSYNFSNSVFCKAILAWLPPPLGLAWALLQPTTHTKYHEVIMNGNANGSYWGSYNVSKSGGCDSFLSFETAFGNN